MHSFLFAETFKYYYLLFAANPKSFDFQKTVYNTEAHPIKKNW
jgi:mannosidase alpha-like ER degradation enhancer 2